MDKKIFYLLAILSFSLAAIMPLTFSAQNQWIYLLSLFTLAIVFVWAAKDSKQIILVLLLLLPFIIYFNYIKLNLSGLLGYFSLPHLSLNLSAALYLIFVLLFLILWKQYPKQFQKTPGFLFILAIIVYTLASVFWSEYADVSFPQSILTSIPFVVFFLSFWIVSTKRDYINLSLVLIGGAALPMLIGLYQVVTGQYFYAVDSSLARITGPFYHPNNFGVYLFLVTCLALILIWSIGNSAQNGRAYLKKFLFAYLILLVVSLVLTYSRTSWGSLLIFIPLFMVGRIRTLVKIGVFLALVFSLVMMFEAPRDRILETFERSSFDSISARETIYKIAAGKIKEKPVFGYGIGTFEEEVRSVKENYESSSFPHNDLLLFTLEQGIIGGLMFVSLSLMVFFKSVRIWLSIKKQAAEKLNYSKGISFDIDFKKWSRGVVAILLVSLIAGMAEATYRHVIFQVTLWSFLGGWFALSEKGLLTREN